MSYAHAFYWALKALTSGPDRDPETLLEVLFSIVVLLLGLSIYATVVGSIGAILLSLDTNNHQWLEKFASIDRFIQSNRLPTSLAMRVQNHYSHLRALGKSPLGTRLLEELPDSLQNDISLHLLADTLREVDVFHNAPKAVLSLVARKLIPKSFPPGERVVTEGDFGASMFFVLRGLLEVTIGSQVVSVLSEGGTELLFSFLFLLYLVKYRLRQMYLVKFHSF